MQTAQSIRRTQRLVPLPDNACALLRWSHLDLPVSVTWLTNRYAGALDGACNPCGRVNHSRPVDQACLLSFTSPDDCAADLRAPPCRMRRCDAMSEQARCCSSWEHVRSMHCSSIQGVPASCRSRRDTSPMRVYSVLAGGATSTLTSTLLPGIAARRVCSCTRPYASVTISKPSRAVRTTVSPFSTPRSAVICADIQASR